MYYLLLCLVLFQQLPEAPQTTLKAPKVIAPKIIAPKAVVESQHSHRCGNCGYVWTHGQSSFGNIQAHTCPKCGAGPWWQQSPTVQQPIQSPMIQYRTILRGGSNCPGGT